MKHHYDAGARRSGLTRAVAAAGSITLVAVSPPFLLGALAVQLRADLDFSPAQLGLAAAAFRGVVAITSAALGRVVDVAGPSLSMRAAALVTTAATLGIALLTDSWADLVLWLVVAGFGSAISGPATNAFIAKSVVAGRRGLAFGVQQSAPPGAALLGGFAVPVVALTVGWRWVFAAAAMLAVAAMLIVPPAVAGTRKRPEPNRSGTLASAGIVAVAVAFGFGAATTMSTFLVEAAVAAGVGEGAAGVLLAVGAASSIVARILTGNFADRWSGDHLRAAAAMLVAGSAGYLALATGSVALMVAGTVIAFGLGWGFSAIVFFAIGRMYPDQPGTAAGVVLTGGSIGGIVTPVIFGYLVELASYQAAWLVTAAWALIAAALLEAGRRRHNYGIEVGDPRRV